MSTTSPLWRCELLLTDACNFNCPYCRGPNQYSKGTLSFDEAKHIVDLWASHNLKNIRFSGGEPTLMKYLVELVAYTKSKGVERIAISTNGSASTELYDDLIDAGVNDFSISLDACCSSVGDMMAGGITGIWEVIAKNIEHISKRSYTTVGVVLTDDNFDQLIDTIEFADSLGVSDIRIISSAQWNNYLKFAELFSKHELSNKHKILNYRIQHFRENVNVRGLGDEDSNRCGLVLDDMAIAGNYHFPCIITMREGIAPIGTIDNKTMDEIRQERYEWFKNTDIKKCKQCKDNCLDVCRTFNNKYEEFHG
jgi:molybdenum cofactor biosynthesis enzyme MoaA